MSLMNPENNEQDWRNGHYLQRDALKNYEFVDSKSHIEIQISDVLIKILSVVFHYIDYEVIGDCQKSINELDLNKLKCLFYLNKLLDVSDSIHKKLLFVQGPLTFYGRRNLFH